MAITLPTVFTLGSKSRVGHSTVHTRKYELNDYYHPGNNRRNYDDNLRVSIEQVEWGQYNPYLNFNRRYSRFRFGIQHDYGWFRFLSGDSNKSSKSGTGSNRDRKRNRHFFYYGFLISLLSIAPVRADEGETNNTSNPVAAATGNVTNQAVQFQNNGAPSRQILGPNISCNGATMTFSPFYMGNHTTPFDENMDQQTYTIAENWGFQINFMVPLDGSIVETCKALGRKQLEKMALDYELVRAKECASLQQKGFMLVPGSRVYHMCNDVVPIKGFTDLVKEEQNKQCTPIEEFRFPWQKKRQKCPKTFKKINPQELLNPVSKFQVNTQIKPPEAH